MRLHGMLRRHDNVIWRRASTCPVRSIYANASPCCGVSWYRLQVAIHNINTIKYVTFKTAPEYSSGLGAECQRMPQTHIPLAHRSSHSHAPPSARLPWPALSFSAVHWHLRRVRHHVSIFLSRSPLIWGGRASLMRPHLFTVSDSCQRLSLFWSLDACDP